MQGKQLMIFETNTARIPVELYFSRGPIVFHHNIYNRYILAVLLDILRILLTF